MSLQKNVIFKRMVYPLFHYCKRTIVIHVILMLPIKLLIRRFSLISLQAKIFNLDRRLSFQMVLGSLALRYGETLSLLARMAGLREK